MSPKLWPPSLLPSYSGKKIQIFEIYTSIELEMHKVLFLEVVLQDNKKDDRPLLRQPNTLEEKRILINQKIRTANLRFRIR